MATRKGAWEIIVACPVGQTAAQVRVTPDPDWLASIIDPVAIRVTIAQSDDGATWFTLVEGFDPDIRDALDDTGSVSVMGVEETLRADHPDLKSSWPIKRSLQLEGVKLYHQLAMLPQGRVTVDMFAAKSITNDKGRLVGLTRIADAQAVYAVDFETLDLDPVLPVSLGVVVG